MKAIKFGIAAGLTCLSLAALAQQPYVFTPIGYQQITPLAVATGLTIPTGAPKLVEICVSTAGVRYRDDGTNPTASVGVPVAAGVCFQYSGSLSAIKFIGIISTAVLDVLYYR